MVRLNSMLSWNTTPMLRRRLSRVMSRRSWPSSVTRPSTGSHRRWSSAMAVDLPAPVWPTRATVRPGGAWNSTPSRMRGPPG